jgi:L-fuconolactonase
LRGRLHPDPEAGAGALALEAGGLHAVGAAPLPGGAPTAARQTPGLPDFPIVDGHVHLWDLTRTAVPWVRGNAVLGRSYLPADLGQQAGDVALGAIVYVEVGAAPQYTLLEADWLVEQAARDGRIQGMVAFAPVEYGEVVRPYLDALVARGPLIKGVRRGWQGGDPRLSVSDDFVRGVQILGEYGLSFDVLAKAPEETASAVRLIARVPGTRFMLDHLLKPDIRQGALEPWRTQLRELAAFPNVYAKISGLVTEADQQSWTPADLAPYVEHALSVFGEDRVVFGGDWPVALQASTYPRWVETLSGLTAGLSPAARRKLFAENARRFYRLPA